MSRKVAVVSHTHWDREWYRSYQPMRRRLIAMFDALLDGLERDPSFSAFLLDGQMAMVDDYLDARPAAEERIRRLAGEGRLTLGPWYVLMDEFCVSAETIVRNLQLGQRRADAFGGAMAVGYLPDMFGHVAQMPQLLRHAGVEHAVVWRGVPSAVDRSAFWWRAPDGSEVRAEYLPVGYSIGAHLPAGAEDLLRRLRAEELELAPFLRDGADAILVMNGTDHTPAQVHVPTLVAAVDDQQAEFDVALTSLPGYLAAAPTDGLPSWTGELRSGSRANLLAGVLSNRTDVKVAAARAERALERRAEPLAALWLPAGIDVAADLDAAWLHLIRNSAHDSICACSADDVGRAVLFRFCEATALADSVSGEALKWAAVAMATAGPVVVNPSPHPRAGLVELALPGTEPVIGTQVLDRVEAGMAERVGVGADLAAIVGGLRADGWLGDGFGAAADLEVGPDGVGLSLVEDRSAAATGDASSVLAEAWVQAGAGRDRPLHVRVERRASQRVLAATGRVAGYGWRRWQPDEPDGAPVTVEGNRMDNALLRVEVDPRDGTFSLGGLTGLGRLVDEGDDGDTYTYSPPSSDVIVDRPDRVRVQPLETGPLRARLRVTRRYAWPEAIVDGSRLGRVDAAVVTDLELRAGEGMLRVEIRFDNRARDHRLRVVLPLPQVATGSLAECAFGSVRRGLDAEGGPHEPGLPTYPSRRFVAAGGLTVTHEGLLEYEVIDGGQALALTLLRATGILSKPAPVNRPNPAGPALPLEDPQMQGPVRGRLALAVGDVDPYRLADAAWLDPAVAWAPGDGPLPDAGSRLDVRGAEVSSLRRVGGALELRVFNPHDRPTEVHVVGASGSLVDLRGRRVGAWAGSFGVAPWGIATARLDP